MSRFRIVPALVLLALVMPAAAATQEAEGFKASLLDDLGALEQKFTQLAEAVPAEDYGWSPMEGVRSVAQVYAHVANANYMFSGMLGHERPADIGVDNAPQNLEQLTDKASIVTVMKRSFPHVRELINGLSEEDLEKEMTLFGQQTTVRSTVLLIMTHMHEHLGQSIAYARSLGVVPPWSS